MVGAFAMIGNPLIVKVWAEVQVWPRLSSGERDCMRLSQSNHSSSPRTTVSSIMVGSGAQEHGKKWASRYGHDKEISMNMIITHNYASWL